MKIKHLKYLAILFFLPLIACSEGNSSDNSMTSNKPAMDYLQQIESAIADKSCSSDTACGLIGVGAKPCGGPETYAAYSQPNVDEEKLHALANAYKKERQDYFKENQIMGICVVTPKPNVACVNNQCIASEQSLQVQ